MKDSSRSKFRSRLPLSYISVRVICAKAYDLHAEQLFDKMERIHAALNAAGIPYRIVGGFGCFLQVYQADPNLARMTPNLDLAIHHADLGRAIEAARSAGFPCVGDTLVDQSGRGSPVHLIPVDRLSAPTIFAECGYFIAPVADLVLMKLTSFRLKDKVHIQDMDGAGLITPEIEQALSPLLRGRLAEVRATL
jgi:hypothetical protein